MEHGLSEAGIIRKLEERLETVEKDVETFAREVVEAKYEVTTLGEDVAMLEEEFGERFDALMAKLYSPERKDFTPAERLQYAIDLGAGRQDVDTYFNALVIAIGEYSGLLTGDRATERLREMSDLIEVYQRHRGERFNEYLGEDGD